MRIDEVEACTWRDALAKTARRIAVDVIVYRRRWRKKQPRLLLFSQRPTIKANSGVCLSVDNDYVNKISPCIELY